MERVNRILSHPIFRASLEEIRQAERERPFCGHGLEHLLAVARLMALEDRDYPRELLYAAALLHDLGRSEEYRCGTPHQEASLTLAGPILADCGFTPGEREEILAAIAGHRTSHDRPRSRLGELLFQADKASRACFLCPAAAACNWPEEKKNHFLLK